ncbi:MAG: DUF4214 domain-containing protein, partial [Telluria sp.]
TVDGGGGLDTMVFSGARGGYTIARSGTGFTVKGATATDLLANIERIQFSDAHIALDVDGTGGQAYRIYRAALGREPDQGGLGFWMKQMDMGVSLADIAAGFISSAEFANLYGGANPTAEAYVEKLYTNILQRKPDPAGYQFWVDAVNKGASRAEVLAAVSEGFENQQKVAEVIGDGFAYVPYGA